METLPHELTAFLLRAKRKTYAGKGAEAPVSSRPKSHDLEYEEPGFLYIDTYLGSRQFAGQEAVYRDGVPVWAMNYCGVVTGEGFSGDFLKEALLRVPEDAPFRGPIEYQDGPHLYCNTAAGTPERFMGREEIFQNGVSVYECLYHGGTLA